ncbi:MAG TPA: anti-sigma F factor antagonist [Candidatus Caccomorpha excrementavium]|nr:anti-sigma F factor antagonist [Candidatus Caccomorpha excrementavium]
MARTRQITIRPGAELAVSGDTLVITLKSDLDHHNAASIRECADQLLSQEGIRHVVFDFTGVEFMDSSGIGVIMGRYKQVIFTGGKAAVCGVGAAVDRIFQFSGIYKIIDRYRTAEEAVRALSGQA